MTTKKFSMQFVDLERLNPTLIFDIRYASENNFLGKRVYPSAKCFLREAVAKKIDMIQRKLQKRKLGLKIFDGYRPYDVQKIFWDFLPDPRYIGDPKMGSRHNRGAAIDLTLVDESLQELLMPTPFDDFSDKAHRDCLDLPKEAIENRQILEEIMGEAGFLPLPTEWWHFDDQDWERYPIENIQFEKIR